MEPWSDHLLVHLLAFFYFLPKRLMFSQILHSTQLDTPCVQFRKKTRYDCLFFEKILQGACADVFTRPTLLWSHANERNIVSLRFAGYRTKEMLGLVAQKFDWFQTIHKKCQQVPTLLLFHANRRNMLGPKMLRVVGQQIMLRPFAWALKILSHFGLFATLSLYRSINFTCRSFGLLLELCSIF